MLVNVVSYLIKKCQTFNSSISDVAKIHDLAWALIASNAFLPWLFTGHKTLCHTSTTERGPSSGLSTTLVCFCFHSEIHAGPEEVTPFGALPPTAWGPNGCGFSGAR